VLLLPPFFFFGFFFWRMLSGAFNELDPSQVVAVCSCFMPSNNPWSFCLCPWCLRCVQRAGPLPGGGGVQLLHALRETSETPSLPAPLKGPFRLLQEKAQYLASVQMEEKIDIDDEDYVDSFKPSLMEVFYQWTKVLYCALLYCIVLFCALLCCSSCGFLVLVYHVGRGAFEATMCAGNRLLLLPDNGLWPCVDARGALCAGASFSDVCELTDIFEGTIVRVARRLDELLNEVCPCLRSALLYSIILSVWTGLNCTTRLMRRACCTFVPCMPVWSKQVY